MGRLNKNLDLGIVRKANAKDVAQITKIANSVKIDFKNLDKEIINRGFLVYVLNEEYYKERLNDYFLVYEENNKINGFLMCYSRIFLKSLITSGALNHKDAEIDFLSNRRTGEKFVFGDQIGVGKDFRGKSVGKKIMNKLFDEMNKNSTKDIYVTILLKPVEHKISLSFCESLGFKHISNVINKDGLIWGVYHLKLE